MSFKSKSVTYLLIVCLFVTISPCLNKTRKLNSESTFHKRSVLLAQQTPSPTVSEIPPPVPTPETVLEKNLQEKSELASQKKAAPKKAKKRSAKKPKKSHKHSIIGKNTFLRKKAYKHKIIGKHTF